MFMLIRTLKAFGKKTKVSKIIIEYEIHKKPKWKNMIFGIGLKVPISFAFSAKRKAGVAEALIHTESIPPIIGITYPIKIVTTGL